MNVEILTISIEYAHSISAVFYFKAFQTTYKTGGKLLKLKIK